MDKPPRVPDVLLERLALGELDPDQAAEVRQRLAQEAEGEARLTALRESNQRILADYPPRQVAAALEQRLTAPPRWRAWLPAPALAAVAVTVLAAIVWLRHPINPAPDNPQLAGDPTERIKGSPQLFLFLKNGEEVVQVAAGDTLKRGDTLQLSYLAGGAKHGVIFSVDGRGAATLHYPASPDDATTLPAGEAHLLPFSYELDDAPAFERFFFVACGRPLDVRQMLHAAEALGANRAAPLQAPPGCAVTETTINKANGGKE